MIIIPKELKFKIIYKFRLRFKISNLCSLLGVSISGYYKHRKLIITKQTKEDKEKYDLNIIKTLVLKYNRKHGYRMITMLIKSKYNLFMNHKKVLRLMKKYGLLSKIRKKNPYSKIIKATKEHRTCKNILSRKFRGLKAFKKLGTDISYLYYNGKRSYISVLKDMITGEIISHKVSSNLGLGFVLNTINNAKDNYNLKGTIIQSDQGVHYTSPIYIILLKDNGIIQSMSRRGRCLDNAPTESFFGHMKDEIDIKNIKSFKKLELYIKKYIIYYNNNRPQWNRKKMTPVEYRNHLMQK